MTWKDIYSILLSQKSLPLNQYLQMRVILWEHVCTWIPTADHSEVTKWHLHFSNLISIMNPHSVRWKLNLSHSCVPHPNHPLSSPFSYFYRQVWKSYLSAVVSEPWVSGFSGRCLSSLVPKHTVLQCQAAFLATVGPEVGRKKCSPLPKRVYFLIPRTCEYYLIWQNM